LKEDQDHYSVPADQYDRPRGADEAYPHPAGPKGVAAVATSGGPGQRGYFFGSFGDTASWPSIGEGGRATAGVWGDTTAGPVAYLIAGEPGQVVVPPCTFPTEAVLAVAAGACQIGDAEYVAGDLRIQGADSALDAVVSGPAGVSLALIVADRRAVPSVDLASDGSAAAWKHDLAGLLAGLAG
jgi:hypothetical protein